VVAPVLIGTKILGNGKFYHARSIPASGSTGAIRPVLDTISKKNLKAIFAPAVIFLSD
jgi:hypothetical protein